MPLPRPAPGTGRWWVIGTIGCTIGIALAVWLGLANSLGAITWTDTDYKVIDDTSVQVGFDVHRSPEDAVVCTVQAQDTAHGVVGVLEVKVPPSAERSCTSRSWCAPPPAPSGAACAAACATPDPAFPPLHLRSLPTRGNPRGVPLIGPRPPHAGWPARPRRP